MKLKKKYQNIFELTMPFYKKGREMDYVHHLVVAEMMINILKEVPLDEEIMIAAALLHDIGYAKIPPEKRKTHWDKQVRKNHMKFGAELAGPILKKAGYPKERIKKICEIAAVCGLTKVMKKVKANNHVLVFTKASPQFIGVGSCKTSIAKFWVGFGVLEKEGDNFYERILTPSQFKKTKKLKHKKEKINLISLKNLKEIWVYPSRFDFAHK